VLDVAILRALYLVVPALEHYGGLAGLLLWYWLIGMCMFALFVVGHDCGHGTFSNSELVNNVIGHVAHGFLLVPFWPWQKSHRDHHKYTSHCDKDKGHPWVRANDFDSWHWLGRNYATNPLSTLIQWNPFYTLVGVPDGSHYWPYSPLFTTTVERVQCAVSAAVCLLFAAIMFALCNYNVLAFGKYYGVPILVHGFWVTMVTFLHHRDERIEAYEEGEWNFVQGQLQTVDRRYGFGIDTLLHHITDGHVVHHFFFTKIPHYHLPEATQAMRKLFAAKYPGVYKRQSTYQFVYEFLRLHIKLDGLVGVAAADGGGGGRRLMYRAAAADADVGPVPPSMVMDEKKME